MQGDQKDTQKDIKDSNLSLTQAVKDSYLSISYTKSDKLITALYMVTNLMDSSEPLRTKLRTLGTEVLLDIHSNPQKALNKISAVLSLLDIASSMHLVSPMNSGILKREFIKLEDSVKEYGKIKSTWLDGFSIEEKVEIEDKDETKEIPIKDVKEIYIGHKQPVLRTINIGTRIGVQKGSTLMKALADKTSSLSNTNVLSSNNFDLLKKKRREDIVSIIKRSQGGLTITDIKTKSKDPANKAESIVSCSDKTLQRELIAMVKDGVLYKTGEKRWSRYFLK